MSNANYLKPGTYNAYCDSCGFKFKADQLRKRWDNMMVDEACWEPRHPQDFLRAIKETSNRLPWTRPNDGSEESASNSPLYVEAGYWAPDETQAGINQFYEWNP